MNVIGGSDVLLFEQATQAMIRQAKKVFFINGVDRIVNVSNDQTQKYSFGVSEKKDKKFLYLLQKHKKSLLTGFLASI